MIAVGQMVTQGSTSRAGIRTVLYAQVVHILQRNASRAFDVAIIFMYLHGENTIRLIPWTAAVRTHMAWRSVRNTIRLVKFYGDTCQSLALCSTCFSANRAYAGMLSERAGRSPEWVNVRSAASHWLRLQAIQSSARGTGLHSSPPLPPDTWELVQSVKSMI